MRRHPAVRFWNSFDRPHLNFSSDFESQFSPRAFQEITRYTFYSCFAKFSSSPFLEKRREERRGNGDSIAEEGGKPGRESFRAFCCRAALRVCDASRRNSTALRIRQSPLTFCAWFCLPPLPRSSSFLLDWLRRFS